MPTTCVVFGCHNRQRKGIHRSFCRIPKEPECRCLAFISRRNEDGSAWEPGKGDCVCSDHFISRKKLDLPTSPDYVPSIPVNSNQETLDASSACVRFGRAQRRVKQQHERERDLERNSITLARNLRALSHDHTYASKNFEFRPCQEQLIIEPARSIATVVALSSQVEVIPAEVGKLVPIYSLCLAV